MESRDAGSPVRIRVFLRHSPRTRTPRNPRRRPPLAAGRMYNPLILNGRKKDPHTSASRHVVSVRQTRSLTPFYERPSSYFAAPCVVTVGWISFGTRPGSWIGDLEENKLLLSIIIYNVFANECLLNQNKPLNSLRQRDNLLDGYPQINIFIELIKSLFI